MFNVRLFSRVDFLRTNSRRVQFNGATFAIAVAALLFTVSLAGCGSDSPFELAPVQGKITYADGSLIQSDQILVQFIPQRMKPQGKVAPRAAQTYADVSDGSFSDLTTWNSGDGVMVGKHKVVVISLRLGTHGAGEPSGAIPWRYHRRETTPLEVDVSAHGDNNFTFEIEKDGT